MIIEKYEHFKLLPLAAMILQATFILYIFFIVVIGLYGLLQSALVPLVVNYSFGVY